MSHVDRPRIEVVTNSLLTLKQAAALYNCSTKTIRRRISAGLLPAYRHGEGPKAHIVVTEEDLRALLKHIPTA